MFENPKKQGFLTSKNHKQASAFKPRLKPEGFCDISLVMWSIDE